MRFLVLQRRGFFDIVITPWLTKFFSASKRSCIVKMTRLSKQCWRCKYFSDNLPEHFKAIANASGENKKSCTHGEDPSAPPPCPQYISSKKDKTKSSNFSSGVWGSWKKIASWGRPPKKLKRSHSEKVLLLCTGSPSPPTCQVCKTLPIRWSSVTQKGGTVLPILDINSEGLR